MRHAPNYLEALRQLPLVDAATALHGRTLVVIAPHPDDESLGAGGLIAAAVAASLEVKVAFLTDGEGSHIGSPTYPPEVLAGLRRAEARAALGELGVDGARAEFIGLPDGRLADLPPSEAAVVVETLVGLIPEETVVCVTAQTDPHPDHRIAHRWAKIASAMRRSELWSYPVWTWTAAEDIFSQPPPQGLRVAIDTHLVAKRNAIAAHRSQHGLVVKDARESFTLPTELLRAADQPFEVFLTLPSLNGAPPPPVST